MKYTVYGPVQLDCVNDYWQVVSKKGAIIATFYVKSDATKLAKELNENTLNPH